ncbi:MAG: transposase [Chloracidobacterium sp.]|nr:transposase [Chloracidobacterium sp.]
MGNISKAGIACPPIAMRIKLSNTTGPNTFHYVTAVTFRRVPVFRNDAACLIFIQMLNEIRSIHPFKLIGYVIMPDHVHFIINPKDPVISVILRKLKGKSARLILDGMRGNNDHVLLDKLSVGIKGRDYAVWQKDSATIDLVSDGFLRQKLDYIHMNPIKAGLCEKPQDWKWSSYRAYFPKASGDVPIEIDVNPYWKLDG